MTGAKRIAVKHSVSKRIAVDRSDVCFTVEYFTITVQCMLSGMCTGRFTVLEFRGLRDRVSPVPVSVAPVLEML